MNKMVRSAMLVALTMAYIQNGPPLILITLSVLWGGTAAARWVVPFGPLLWIGWGFFLARTSAGDWMIHWMRYFLDFDMPDPPSRAPPPRALDLTYPVEAQCKKCGEWVGPLTVAPAEPPPGYVPLPVELPEKDGD